MLGRVRRMPPALLVAAGAAIAVLLVWAGIEAYQTYDYVQHDNEFCLSCHLMVDPYERFARSEHADLGCKACHQPTLMARSSMALTQIIQNPDSLSAHAHVPNAACIECHVDGDPEKWSNIAASAGHRVHFESDDASIDELQCVKCHSSAIHEFTATDQTCGQAGCHENQRIQLGAMGALTIHCAACHSFNAQVAAASTDSAQLALEPQRDQCLGCHAMQVRLANFPIPEQDPHAGMCASCHNPHEQTESAQAFETCGDCHAQADTLTPFHRGLDAGVLDTCSRCHQAHTFRVEGHECRACHTDPAMRSPATRPAPAAHPGRTSALREALDALAALLLPTPVHAQQSPPPARQRFDHARHTDIECTACHSVAETHGAVTIASARDCQSCHHTGSTVQPCSRCHDAASVAGRGHDVRRAWTPSVGRSENRTYRFEHSQHGGLECTRCHMEGLELSAGRVSCVACHDEHHDASSSCVGCHQAPPSGAHTAAAHLTCAGSGCHSPAPVNASQRTRTLCLTCHRDMTDHRPGRRCGDCHSLPPARQAAAADSPALLAPPMTTAARAMLTVGAR